jgi:serine/threonine protein kinase/DNA-binding beta-propeller fold protein YncE
MPLAPGAKLGPYEIVSPLGVGGMGEVYRAWDKALGRDVAIKILRAVTWQDPDRLRRFRQEAQSTASLNHPNILAIHLVAEHDGLPFIVSELLEGESLRERIRRGPLPLRKAMEYASQIVDGLSAAHANGIVHRDLKPENIFLTKDSRVKILDFGLAKLMSPGETSADANAVTLTQGSAPGIVLGTVGYMSPEQVRGLPLDTRSDIFSFGVILYEMISGKNVFLRDTPADTMSALLREDAPELSQSSGEISVGLDRVVRRCLEKEPADRFQSVRDLGFALQAVSGSGTTSSSPALPVTSSRRMWRLGLVLLTTAASLGILVGYLVEKYQAARRTFAQPQFQQLTFRRGTVRSARFAPDGQTIVYGASLDGLVPRLYTTRGGSPESQPLGPNNINLLSVSSAGELAVTNRCSFNQHFANCEGTFARMPYSGGAPREMAEHVVAADWTSNGRDLAIIRHSGGHFLVEFPMGRVIYDTTGYASGLRVSPDSKYVAIADHPALGNDAGYVLVLDSEGHQITKAGPWNSLEGLAWSPDGKEVWFSASEGNEGWADQIRALHISGGQRMMLRLPGFTHLHDVARDGRLLLAKEEWRGQLSFVGPNNPKPVDLSWLDNPVLCDLSRDGNVLIFSEVGEAGGNAYLLYLRRTDGSPAVRLGEAFSGAISPDGQRVFAVTADYPARLVLMPTGAGDTKLLPNSNLKQFVVPGWTPDGKEVAFAGSDGHGWRFFLQDLEGGAPRSITPEIAVHGYYEGQFVSPDGKYVWTRDAEGKGWLYDLDGSKSARPVQGLEALEGFAGWGADNRKVFVFRSDSYPLKIYELDFVSGQRRLIKEFMPEDPVGLDLVTSVRVSPDGQHIAYANGRSLSTLYVVTGLK